MTFDFKIISLNFSLLKTIRKKVGLHSDKIYQFRTSGPSFITEQEDGVSKLTMFELILQIGNMIIYY